MIVGYVALAVPVMHNKGSCTLVVQGVVSAGAVCELLKVVLRNPAPRSDTPGGSVTLSCPKSMFAPAGITTVSPGTALAMAVLIACTVLADMGMS